MAERILVTTPSVLVGYRVEVYRAEGTTQWYTAVIVSYNENTQELTLTDDTVLEEHNEDPCLVQMKLIGDGVVESILKGENVGITPRRRACTSQQNPPVHYSTRTRSNPAHTYLSTSRLTATAIARKSRNRPGIDGIPRDNPPTPLPADKVGSIAPLDSSHRSQVERRRKASESESAVPLTTESRVACRRLVGVNDKLPEENLPRTSKRSVRSRFQKESTLKDEDTDSIEEEEDRRLLTRRKRDSPSRNNFCHHDNPDGQDDSRDSDESDVSRRTENSNHCPINSTEKVIRTRRTTRCGRSQETNVDSKDDLCRKSSENSELFKDSSSRVVISCVSSRTTSCSEASNDSSVLCSASSPAKSCTWTVPVTAVVSSVSVVLTPLSPSVVSAAVGARDSPVESKAAEPAEASPHCQTQDSSSRTSSEPSPKSPDRSVPPPPFSVPCNSESSTQCLAPISVCQDASAKGADSPPRPPVSEMSQLDRPDRPVSASFSAVNSGKSSPVPATKQVNNTSDSHSSRGPVPVSEAAPGKSIKDRVSSSEETRKAEDKPCKHPSSLGPERHEPVRVYRDLHLVNNNVRHVDCLHHGLMHPAGLSHGAAAAAAYPRVPSLPQHTRAPGTPLPATHLAPYGLSPHLLSPHVPAATAAAAAGPHLDQHSLHSQAYRHILSQHALLPQYSSPVGLDMLNWTQKYPPHMTTPPTPNPWMVAHYQEELRLERERALVQERDRQRIERERREEQERLEREKAEREKVEKERAERERQEKERQERERQERERLEREERERAQREAVQQHFEESLRFMQKQQKSMGWSPMSTLPLSKSLSSSSAVGHNSPAVSMSQASHNQAIHSTDLEQTRDKTREKDVKERFGSVDTSRLRPDHDRWITVVQPRNESVAALQQSLSQNISPSEARPGSGQPKPEGYSIARSSPHSTTNISGHSTSKSGVAPSPVPNVHSSSVAVQHKQEPSFSLYGYQPFQHTYITQAQLKAREENKGSSSLQQVIAPSGRQPNIKQEKEASIPFDRPTTPSSSRTGNSSSQATLLSTKQQLKIMHPQSQDRTSPMYQPLVGGGGAFKPYEYSSHSPAPAHQNTSSPTLTGRMGGSSYHPSHQEQPQNLVKGDSKGTVHDHSTSQSQTHHKYDSSRPPASTPPTAVPASYTPPYTGSKNASPVTSATYSYSLIQQGLVPNPLYTPAHSGASTTAVATVTTATPTSPQAPSKPPSQAGSPPMVQQYPRATPGTGITSGTPICRSSSVPYPIHQSRSAHSYSPGGPASTPGMTPNRTSTPQEAHSGSRSHISTPGANHRSPSPAHLYGVSPGSLPQPNTPTPPLHVSRAPPSTSPRISTTPNPPHISRVPLHPGNSPLPTISPPQPSSTPDNQPQPLNLQNSGNLVKRKTSKDGNGRKRQRTNEEHLLPPQLQPQVVHPDSSPPVTQLGTPPQLVSNTSISLNTSFSNSTSNSTSSSSNSSSNASHSQTQPVTPLGHSPQTFSASDSPSVSTPSETCPQASSISSSSHGSGFMESFCSFVSSAQQDQYQTYYNKHAKGRNKITSEHSTSTPAEITDTFVRPSSNSNSSATSLQSTGGGSQEASDESRVSTSPASSTSTSLSTTSAASTGSSSNHTKLKKAWLQRHSENEDKKNPSEGSKPETPVKSSVSEPTPLSSETKSVITSSSSNAKSSSSPSTASSREGRTSSSSGTNEGNSVNGPGSKNPPAETPAEDDSTSSASETEHELKNLKRKTRVSRKAVSSATNTNSSTTTSTSSKRQKLSSESQNDSLEEMPNIKKEKETNKRKSVPPERETTNNSRRRGRKTKGRCSVPDDSQKKKSPKPPEKPSVARLKRTGEPFLQDGPCCEVAPKLPKCRECRMTPHQRSKKMPNIFCRFYAYRKLRYGKNGTILGAGFSEPSDAADCDLRLWLPPLDSPPSDLEMETSKFLLTHVGDQFCDLVEQEREAQSLHMSEDKTVTWKRVVQGVREMCDVCETTLFNFHWVCHKCGFVVCIDCYKARKNGTVKEDQSPPKDRDEYQWLLCSNRQHHEQEKLMMTQIIAGSALWDVGKLLHEVRRKWNIPAYCNCSNKDSDSDSKHSANGICKQLMNAVTKCFSSDKDPLQVNGISECPRLTRKSGKSSVNGVIKQEDGLSGYSSESGGSPLSWLADVALNSSGKLKEDRKKSKLKADDDDDDTKDDKNSESQLDGTDGLGDSDDERSENFSTLRELLIRPTGKLGGKNSGTNSNSQKTLTSTLDEVISCVIEQRVRKSDKKSKDEKQLVHFTRRYQQSRSGRELLPIRACALAESTLLYPDIPHTWLCSGILLQLKDPSHSGNLQLFQEQWKRGQPVLVADVTKKLDSSLWNPESFIRDFGDIKNDFVNCKTGAVLPHLPMRKFWEGFENVNKRIKDDDGESMLLKLKDWPPGEEFSELLPARYQDLMKALPLSQYTSRSGCFNLASCLPDCFVRPDLGPKMHNAYGSPFLSDKGTTNLHLEISDSVNVMVYVGIPKDSKDDSHIQEALRVIDEGGCDSAMKRRSREKGSKPGALWHIYHARDADKIRDLLNKVSEENGRKLEPHHDSIHSQEWYMDEELRNRLYKEYGVEGYAVVQCMGDSLFIPAGAPHQVCNLHSCIKVVDDFVSPENVGKSFALTQEFRHLSDTNVNNEDKLQIKNIIYHAVKDVLALLESSEPEDCKT